MRKLADIQEEAEKLSVDEQVELAHRLLDHARRTRGREKALLSEAVLARDWVTEQDERASTTVSVAEAVQGLRELRSRYRVSPGEIADMIEEGRK